MVSDSQQKQPLNPDEISNLLEFIGYGNIDGPVWFLGMEEGGGGEERIRIQSRFDPIEGLRDAHVNKMGITRYHCGNRVLQSTWEEMCHIMLSLAGIPPDIPTRRTYQATHLGRMNSDTLMAELMPVAKSTIKVWPYLDLMPAFTNRRHYYDEVLPKRLLKFRELVRNHEPKLIVAYGRAYWPYYQAILPSAEFHNSGRFRYGVFGQTTMVLTDHFSARTMNGLTPEVVALIKKTSPELGSQLAVTTLSSRVPEK